MPETDAEMTKNEALEKQMKIQELVGFLPNIGNVFRTLYCHLETFVHLVYQCTDNVNGQMKRGERTIERLGLQGILTDLYFDDKWDGQVPPFIGVYKEQLLPTDQQESSENVTPEVVSCDAYPGEIRRERTSNAWEEEMLVEALATALLHMRDKENPEKAKEFKTTKFPVLPCDLNHSDIAGIGNSKSSDDMAAYLAMRAASIFGISKYIDSDAESIGKADAFAYYETVGSKEDINNVLKTLGSSNRADTLYNYALCEGDYALKNKLSFEKQGVSPMRIMNADGNRRPDIKRKTGRQPMFVKENNALTYCYSEDDVYDGMIPIRLSSYGDLKDVFDITSSKNGYSCRIKLSGDSSTLLYSRNSEKLLNSLRDLTQEEKDKKKVSYTNDEIFTVFYGGTFGDGASATEKVVETYNSLKDGEVVLNGYKADSDAGRFKSLLNNYWFNIDDEKYDEVYNTSLWSLAVSNEKCGIKEEDVIQSDGSVKDENYTSKYDKLCNNSVFRKDGKYYYTDDSDKVAEIGVDELFLKNSCLPIVNGDNTESYANVFSTPFYYMQNGTEKETLPVGWTNEMVIDRAKAMLFLMSMNREKCWGSPKFLTVKRGIVEGVPLPLMLLYGGLVWRKRFFDKTNNDVFAYALQNATLFTPMSYKAVEKDSVPFFNGEDGLMPGIIHAKSTKAYAHFKELFNEDITCLNALEKCFETFVKETWPSIRDNCELKTKEGKTIGGTDFLALQKIFDNTSPSETFSNLGGRYDCVVKLKNGDIDSYFSETNPAQEAMKRIYLQKTIVQSTVNTFDDKNGVVSISDSTFKNYLNGFVKQIEEICGSETVNTIEKTELDDSDNTNIEIKRSIYLFIKNLWDRWLLPNADSESRKMFTAEHFMKNTVFMDSMYRNVHDKIHINCEKLLDYLDSSDGTKIVFQFISDITTFHHCMFFALPDYLDLGNPDPATSYKAMEDLFTPIPYSKINPITTMNRYMVMFSKPSDKSETNNGYRSDTFDIYSHDEDASNILPTFKTPALGPNVSETDKDYDIQLKRYGYNVPAFGVEVNRQHNSIFKNVSIGMQNPVMTSEAINALSLIAARGRNGGEKIIFYGQDLYNMYSGYSYTATVTMMGNAQIMPLMYFQLFNLPMFRGAYMIYGVTHTMKPGDMTTTFKAMKMSRFTQPYCTEWFGDYYFDEYGNFIGSADDACIVYSGDTPWMQAAEAEFKKGVKEEPKGSNRGTDVDKYIKATGLTPPQPWCACFVTWCLKQCGIKVPSNSGGAAAWVSYGKTLDKPIYGAIAIIAKDKLHPSHVGFVCGNDNKGNIVILGGNQSDAVTKSSWFSKQGQIIKYVMPEGYTNTTTLQRADDSIDEVETEETTTL